MFVKDMMNKDPIVFYQEDSILSASDLMKDERIRNVPVIDESGTLIGLITLREIVEAMKSNPKKKNVKEAMITEVTTVTSETPLKGAIEIMLLNRYGCLPVLNSKRKLIGILTEFDLLKALYELTKVPETFYKYYNVR